MNIWSSFTLSYCCVLHAFTPFLVKALSLINSLPCDLCLGGFEGFSGVYPELCYNSSGNHLSAVEPEPAATGRTTPAYDQARRSSPFMASWSLNQSSCDNPRDRSWSSQGGPVELLPFLYLGSAIHSSRRETLAAAGITAVLNVSSTCPNAYEGEFQYLRLTVEDSLAADIRACFSTAIAFIGEFPPADTSQ